MRMRRKGGKAHTQTHTHTHRSDWSCSDFSGCVGLVCTLRWWHCTTLVAGSTTSYLAAASPAVGGGQADRVDDKVDDKVNSVDDMVVGDKLEERDTHDEATEEEQEEQAAELKVDKEATEKDEEEEEKEDKENEGTEDNPAEAELELSR